MPKGTCAGKALNDLDELLPAIAAGDEAAFARWLAGAETPVRESLRRFARNVDTEAILQEALLRTWQIAPRLRSDGRANGLLRFAIVAARNLAISETRRRRREELTPDPEEMPADPSPSFPDPILARWIAHCRDALPLKPKQALTARLEAAGGQSDQELADRIGMRLNTFLQNIIRARRILAKCLERAGVKIV